MTRLMGAAAPLVSCSFFLAKWGGRPVCLKKMGLGLGFFLWCLLKYAKLPPFCVSYRPIFIAKMLFGPKNWFLNFLFL